MPDATVDWLAQEPDREILLHNLIGFVRLLRDLGLGVNPEQSMDFVKALTLVDMGRRADVYSAARCILVKRHDDLPLFDLAFTLFWQERRPSPDEQNVRQRETEAGDRAQSGSSPRDPAQGLREGGREHPVPRLPDWLRRDSRDRRSATNSHASGAATGPARHTTPSQDDDSGLNTFTYSPVERLWHKKFEELSESEVIEAEQLLSNQTWNLPRRPSRRMEANRTGERLDPRRTTRQGIRHGGEFVRLSWRSRRQKRHPLVIISDISGSMEQYARLLLRFMYVLRHGLDKTEVFVFSTQLTRITRDLTNRSVDQALKRVTQHVADWSGGTRIGQALHTFNHHWARRVLGHGTIVVIVSDGWDQGDLDLLRREMAHLQRRCYRLVWMNPLLGNPAYVPRSAGMLTALPYIDNFLPAHNLASLAAFLKRLCQVEDRRPLRRQVRSDQG